MAHKKNKLVRKASVVTLRLTDNEKIECEKLASKQGFSTTSEYFRKLHQENVNKNKKLVPNPDEMSSYRKSPKLFHKTKLGRIYHGDLTHPL